jgi:Tfp pilus assembly pilus retraction ATPase PilT
MSLAIRLSACSIAERCAAPSLTSARACIKLISGRAINALQTGQAHGMQTMAQSLQQLQRQGEISPEMAKTVTDS